MKMLHMVIIILAFQKLVIQQNQPKSVVCFPIINKGDLTGIIYLENNKVEGTFTPARLEVLNLLSSQIAISIENATQYKNLKEEVRNRQLAERSLKKAHNELEIKVEERTEELSVKNTLLNKALEDVEQSKKKIMDSISYSQRIQNSLLPNIDTSQKFLPQSFYLWKPRDVVSGDIYYAEAFDNGFIIAVIDCTGHGVPGAFMTMMASSGLRRITIDEGCLNPAEILSRLNSIIKTSLHQDTEHATSDDGLDASICFVNTNEKTLTYAGARLPLVYIKNGKIIVVRGDRHSIGYKRSNLNFEFSNHQIDIEAEMVFYLYTDGIVDQLGGEKIMPFGKTRFHNLLLDNHNRSFEKQQNEIFEVFEKYMGENERQDDVTVVGFSV